MHTAVIRTYQQGNKDIAIRPTYNYAKAKQHFSDYVQHNRHMQNVNALKSIDCALHKRPGYTEYLKEKAYLLQKTGYNNEAYKIYRLALETDKKRTTIIIVNDRLKNRDDVYTEAEARKKKVIERFDYNHTVFHPRQNKKMRTLKGCMSGYATRVVCSLLLPVLFSLISSVAQAQSVNGYIRNSSGTGLQNIMVEVTQVDEPTNTHSATTDANGFYQISNVSTDIENENALNKPTITISESKLHITYRNYTNHVRLYNLEGKLLKTEKALMLNEHCYKTSFDLGNINEKILLVCSSRNATKIVYSNKGSMGSDKATPKLKSKTRNFVNFHFDLSDPQGMYQSLSELKEIDIEGSNQVDFELEEHVAYFWRKFEPEISESGTTATLIIKNDEFNYNDTIFNVGLNSWWKDTVPVNPNGTTEYELKYITPVPEGEIPHYDLVKTIELSKDEQSIGKDNPKALEQQQKIKGKVTYFDNKANATGVDLIFRDSDGNIVDSLRTIDGYYEVGPYPVNTDVKTLDVHVPEDHPTNKDEEYFGHKGIPIIYESQVGDYGINTGRLTRKEKVTHMNDSIRQYNITLTPTKWTDPESGELAQVNPAHLVIMDGTAGWDLPNLRERPINVYFKPTSQNNQWLYVMADKIENNFGIPFQINEVSEELSTSNLPNVTSLDEEFLNSIEHRTGMNVEVNEHPGLTYPSGTAENYDNIPFFTVEDIRIRGPPIGGLTGTEYMINEDFRELLGRRLKSNEISNEYYLSVINPNTPINLDTAKMIYDQINFNIIHNHRKARINSDEKERVHNGQYTLRPNKNSDFYSTKTQNELYDEERFKHWDTTGIPEFNQKFFD
ncbi:carboxypeptidase-like regulatory domain-containing protein [Saccharicrinis sp. 156]|uniref:carboxypeptidase-like regulatory domain-containing protein n=1 Tax=Saccharicrinis sp. 156 TaxID=3417574 RepID=UPI003D324E35